jgi:hypothetical protein
VKLLVLGASTTDVCGVRDSAARLEPELTRLGFDVETVWREPGAAIDHTAILEAADRADIVLWHYSVFGWSRRGVPTEVPRLARRLAQRARLVPYLHEPWFPFGRNGARGFVWASTQRAALRPLVSHSSALIVTAEDRARWFESRKWLPARRIAFVPVHANVEPTATEAPQKNGALRLGVFGYRRDGQPSETIVASAIARLRAQGLSPQLKLIGAPGTEGPEAERWRVAARNAGIEIAFSGVLPADELSRELTALDLLLFTDDCGPTPRRGTLAAALAHARPVVAFAGDQTWGPFREAGVTLVDRTPEALADAVSELAADPSRRAQLGAQARAFYDLRLSPDVGAATIAGVLHEAST